MSLDIVAALILPVVVLDSEPRRDRTVELSGTTPGISPLTSQGVSEQSEGTGWYQLLLEPCQRSIFVLLSVLL